MEMFDPRWRMLALFLALASLSGAAHAGAVEAAGKGGEGQMVDQVFAGVGTTFAMFPSYQSQILEYINTPGMRPEDFQRNVSRIISETPPWYDMAHRAEAAVQRFKSGDLAPEFARLVQSESPADRLALAKKLEGVRWGLSMAGVPAAELAPLQKSRDLAKESLSAENLRKLEVWTTGIASRLQEGTRRDSGALAAAGSEVDASGLTPRRKGPALMAASARSRERPPKETPFRNIKIEQAMGKNSPKLVQPAQAATQSKSIPDLGEFAKYSSDSLDMIVARIIDHSDPTNPGTAFAGFVDYRNNHQIDFRVNDPLNPGHSESAVEVRPSVDKEKTVITITAENAPKAKLLLERLVEVSLKNRENRGTTSRLDTTHASQFEAIEVLKQRLEAIANPKRLGGAKQPAAARKTLRDRWREFARNMPPSMIMSAALLGFWLIWFFSL